MNKQEFDSKVDKICLKLEKNVVPELPELPRDLDAFMEYLKAWAKRAVPKGDN